MMDFGGGQKKIGCFFVQVILVILIAAVR